MGKHVCVIHITRLQHNAAVTNMLQLHCVLCKLETAVHLYPFSLFLIFVHSLYFKAYYNTPSCVSPLILNAEYTIISMIPVRPTHPSLLIHVCLSSFIIPSFFLRAWYIFDAI